MLWVSRVQGQIQASGSHGRIFLKLHHKCSPSGACKTDHVLFLCCHSNHLAKINVQPAKYLQYLGLIFCLLGFPSYFVHNTWLCFAAKASEHLLRDGGAIRSSSLCFPPLQSCLGLNECWKPFFSVRVASRTLPARVKAFFKHSLETSLSQFPCKNVCFLPQEFPRVCTWAGAPQPPVVDWCERRAQNIVAQSRNATAKCLLLASASHTSKQQL